MPYCNCAHQVPRLSERNMDIRIKLQSLENSKDVVEMDGIYMTQHSGNRYLTL